MRPSVVLCPRRRGAPCPLVKMVEEDCRPKQMHVQLLVAVFGTFPFENLAPISCQGTQVPDRAAHIAKQLKRLAILETTP